jgi:hypothetical protein
MIKYYIFGEEACNLLADSFEALSANIDNCDHELVYFNTETDDPTDLLYLLKYEWSDYSELTKAQYIILTNE